MKYTATKCAELNTQKMDLLKDDFALAAVEKTELKLCDFLREKAPAVKDCQITLLT